MDFKAIEEMIQVMDNSSLGYLEINWQEVSIIMKKKGESGIVKLNEESSVSSDLKSEIKNANSEKTEADMHEDANVNEKVQEDKSSNIKEVVSPIVGTFYSKSDPDKPDYVSVGDKIKKGDTLCIIEAMKIMNEIQSDVDGEIIEIDANNEDMVEYGQTLFKVKLNS